MENVRNVRLGLDVGTVVYVIFNGFETDVIKQFNIAGVNLRKQGGLMRWATDQNPLYNQVPLQLIASFQALFNNDVISNLELYKSSVPALRW